jgi:methyl-accepting chemotaxis protein
MGMAGGSKPRSRFWRFPAFRFRVKIMLGFLVVLAVSTASLGIAYLGFERVASAVASYHDSVSEADRARNIDRELISYRALVKYYVVTGKDDDAKAALSTETGLRAAIDQALKDTRKAGRREGLDRLAGEFKNFATTFADLLKIKRDSALLAQNQLARGANMLRYKLDDIASNAAEAGLPAVELGAKQVSGQLQAAIAIANTFVINSDQTVAAGALARLKFVDHALQAISATDDNLVAALKEAAVLLGQYTQALTSLVENAKTVDDLVTAMSGAAGAITQGSTAMKADLVAEQQRLEAENDNIIGETERLIVLLATGGFLLGAVFAVVLGSGISRPMTAMCKAMRELAGGHFDVVLPGLGRNDELGEMASAVEEFKLQATAKAERDAAAQDGQNKTAGAARRAELIRFAEDFEAAVGAIVSSVSASAEHLEHAAGTLTRTAENTQRLSGQAADRSEEASGNVQSVASATEELSVSVDEIGRRVRESSRIAEEAVAQAEQTDGRIGKLSRAAQEIGDVVKLITAIAEQTNLLALNATIEAARAGASGRGFAVVAAEVKSLSEQTAKATDEISHHISSMQGATQESVKAIKEIGTTIGQISSIAASIASAVEQQGGATQQIARNVQSVAQGTREAAANIVEVNRGATETGAASGDVLSSAKALSSESTRLKHELDRFMTNIRAA